MKTLLALLLLIPFNLSALDVKDYLERSEASLLDLGMFKLEVYLDNNISEIEAKALERINREIVKRYRDKYLSELDFSFSEFQTALERYLKKHMSFYEFKVSSGYLNEPNRIYIGVNAVLVQDYAMGYLNELKDNFGVLSVKESERLFKEISDERIEDLFDSEKFCKIVREELMKDLSIKMNIATLNSDEYEGLIRDSHKDIYQNFFSKTGYLFPEKILENGKLLNIHTNVVYNHGHYKKSGEYIYELIACHGLIGETNPSYKKSNDPSDYMDFQYDLIVLQ